MWNTKWLVTLVLSPLFALGGCGDAEESAPRSEGGGDRPIRSTSGDPADRADQKPPAVHEAMYGGEGRTRIGDPGLTFLEADQQRFYPNRAVWGEAGVEGGIILPGQVIEVEPGGDIQRAIDQTEAGVVQMIAPRYELTEPLSLKSGVVLRGAEGGTTLALAEPGNGAVLNLIDLEGAGIARLRLEIPERGEPVPRDAYANRKGFTGTDEAAINMIGCRNSWIDGVTVINPVSHPLVVRGVRHGTVRDFTVRGVQNRGSDAGDIIIADSGHLLMAGLKIRDARALSLIGPVTDSVFRSGVMGCGVYFREADRVSNNLFEDLHFLFPPGYPLAPFAKGPMPMGSGNRIVNCATIYHHGTDAVSGNLMQPRVVFGLNRYADRVSFDPETGEYDRARFITPLQYERVLNPNPGPEATVIDARWKQPPPDVPIQQLRHGATIDDWVATGPVGGEALDLPVTPLLEEPMVPETQRDLNGKTAAIAMFTHDDAPRDPANVQQMVGRFGRAGLPPTGQKVDLLEQVDGDWENGLVLQQVAHVPGKPRVSLKWKTVGCKVRIFLNETEVEPEKVYELQPGYHAITVFASMNREMELVTTANLDLRLSLHGPPQPSVAYRNTPEPTHGFLYPYRPAVDPLAEERAALAAWSAYFDRMRGFPWGHPKEDTRAMIEQHPNTHVAWVAGHILRVLEGAPYEEGDELTPRQWGELADYYHRAGMPERKWAINRGAGPAKFRAYYPEAVEEVQ